MGHELSAQADIAKSQPRFQSPGTEGGWGADTLPCTEGWPPAGAAEAAATTAESPQAARGFTRTGGSSSGPRHPPVPDPSARPTSRRRCRDFRSPPDGDPPREACPKRARSIRRRCPETTLESRPRLRRRLRQGLLKSFHPRRGLDGTLRTGYMAGEIRPGAAWTTRVDRPGTSCGRAPRGVGTWTRWGERVFSTGVIPRRGE
jgi:hypothetical protein